MLTPGQYTHHPKCPHLIATLQRVVDEVALPMWMPGHCSGTTPILVRGPRGPRAAAAAAPAPQVEVYPTPYGAVVQVVVPPTVYETVQALGYHHLGDLYTGDHQVLPERALKGRAPARKGIPGLRAYHRGQPLRVTAAMQDTMEIAGWAPELRVCQQPPGTLPSDRRLHRLLVALLGIQVQVDAPLHAQLWGDHRQESLAQLQRTGVWVPTIVWMATPPTAAYCRWAKTSQAPLVTVTAALPPFPWIAIAPAAVAHFQYPAECVAHRCPGHPHKGPLYYSPINTTCLLCGAQPETAPHLWACSAQSHEWGPARRRLAAWLDQKVGPRAAPVRHQLWEPAVLEQWAAALRTPSMQLAHLECTGPHALGTEFLRHVIEESIRVWYAHAKARATLLKARLGPGSTMAWALQELRLHQQAEQEGVQRELLE